MGYIFTSTVPGRLIYYLILKGSEYNSPKKEMLFFCYTLYNVTRRRLKLINHCVVKLYGDLCYPIEETHIPIRISKLRPLYYDRNFILSIRV